MIKRLISALICLLLFCLIINYSRQILKLVGAGQGLKKKEAEASLLKKKNRELEERLEEVASQSFIEETAREKLGMSKPGEVVVIMPEFIPEKQKDAENRFNEPNWKKWWKVFGD